MNQKVNSNSVGLGCYRIGPYILNTNNRTVVNDDGDLLEITGKSYQLLEALVLAAPNSLSLQDIHKTVWPNTSVSDDTVRQRIKIIRQALDVKPGNDAYVRSEHGIGYSVVAHELKSDKYVHSPWIKLLLSIIVATSIILGGYYVYEPEPSKKPRILVSVFNAPYEDDLILARGFTGELIDKLTPIEDFQIAKNLNNQVPARALIEGQIIQTNESLEISIRILDGKTGDVLWNRKYSDKLNEDIFSVQANIAAHVALILQAKLDDEILKIIEQGPTSNIQAYYDYMIGRGYLLSDNREEAAKYFAKSLAADPNFKLAKSAIEAL